MYKRKSLLNLAVVLSMLLSLGLGVKVPVWTDINEENEQQGGEGTEDDRFLFTFSVMLP